MIYTFAGSCRRTVRILIWGVTALVMKYFTPEIYGGLGSDYCLAFSIGIGLAAMRNKPIKIIENKITKILIAILTCAGFCFYFGMDRLEMEFFGMKIHFWICVLCANLIGFVQMLAIIGLVRMIENMKAKKYLIAWGNVSFYVYLMHTALLLMPFQHADTQLEKMLAFIWSVFGWGMVFYVLNRNMKKTAK